MKKSLLLLSIVSAFFFTGCNGDPNSIPDSKLYKKATVYEKYSYTPAEFGKFLGHSFDDYCNYLSDKLPIPELLSYSFGVFVDNHRSIIDEIVAAETGFKVSEVQDKWSFCRYNYKYETTSYTGEPITLSAALIVPAVNITDFKHTISAISLCPPHMAIEDGYGPTTTGTVLMGRAVYNHAVIVPDFQGRGVTSGMTYSCLHTYDHATQAIDAVFAAKSLLEDLGYKFKDGIELYNVGVSEGGEKSYVIHKRIENDLTDNERKALNLKHNYAANGSIDHVQYVKDKVGRVEYTGDQEDFEESMEILKDAFECLTPEEKRGYESSVFYSTAILNPDGKTVNAEHPAVIALEDAMKRNNITYNWDPKSPLCLVGSTDDTTIEVNHHAVPAYEMLKYHPDWSANKNVELNTFSTPVVAKISELVGEKYMVAHAVADIICFIHSIENEDPASVKIQDQL